MSKDYDEKDGIWRTVGGRRIFIRTGQSLSDAMKKSGKFKRKNTEKKERTTEQVNKEYEELSKKMQKDDYYYKSEDDKKLKELRTEYDTKVAKGEKDVNLIKSQQSDIEKASGLKVKKAFETDSFGNGKEDRFELEDGRWISHTTESFGSKDDTWSVNTFDKGTVKSEDFKSYDDMIKHLGGSKKDGEIKETPRVKEVREQNQKWRESLNNTNYSQKELDNVYKKEDYTEVIEHLSKSDLRKMKEAAHDMNDSFPNTEGYKAARDFIQRKENEAAAKFLDNKTKSGTTAYKKAFEEYKKKHPNTKLSLVKFINMSEGK